MYDYLIVGSGLFGSVCACEAKKAGKTCLVVEKRDHIGGNIYTREIEGIQVHQYGAHIFHTSNRRVWDYVQPFAEFKRYTNSPIAYYKGAIYNMTVSYTHIDVYKRQRMGILSISDFHQYLLRSN